MTNTTSVETISLEDSNNTQIIIDNNHTAQLVTSAYYFKKVNKLLSYKEEGVEFSPRFKNSNWDGTHHLMSKTGKFTIGLVNKVKDFLEENEVNVTVVDNRKVSVRNKPIDLVSVFAKDGIVPRDYQLTAVENCYNSKLSRGIIKSPTGSGKSKMISLLLAKFNTSSIVHVIGLDLLDQFYEELVHLFPNETIGYIGNSKVIIGDRFTVASIWTTGSSLDLSKKDMATDEELVSELPVSTQDKLKIVKLLKETELHVFDECHVCSCSTIQNIYKHINPKYIFGFSGTPHRAMNTGSDLIATGILGPILMDISASDLISRGVLVAPNIIYRNVPHMPNVGSTYAEVYKNYIVENEQRNAIIVNDTKKLIDKGYTVLVLFKSIKHGNILHEKFAEAGIDHEFLSGKDTLEQREEVKNKVKSGKCKVALTSVIWEIGLDLPILSALISSAGKSYVRIFQRVGRIIRGYVDPTGHKKENAIVIEFMDNAKYLRQHSIKRYEIYKTEPKFNIKTCDSMKKYI